MNIKPEWLPDMIDVSGDWTRILAQLYEIFCLDFKKRRRQYDQCEVWYDRSPCQIASGSYETGFWHLISKDEEELEERLFDSRRAERLPWCGPTISNSAEADVKCWDYLEQKNRVRTYIWLEKLNYVVVLQKKSMRVGRVYFLVTAYYVESESRRRSFERKYLARQ